jgi:hypothetical protein
MGQNTLLWKAGMLENSADNVSWFCSNIIAVQSKVFSYKAYCCALCTSIAYQHLELQVAATEEKTALEEAQRAAAKERKMKCVEWVPKYYEQVLFACLHFLWASLTNL